MMLARVAQRSTALSTGILKQTLNTAILTGGVYPDVGRPLGIASRVLSSTSEKESYTARQLKTGRPISPHVEIYDFPPAAISSITNRITGVALVGGLYGLAGLSLVGCDTAAVMSIMGSSMVGPVVKLTVSFPLVYHYLGAVRHIAWDYMPSTLQTSGVTKSSYALFGVTGLVSLGLAVV